MLGVCLGPFICLIDLILIFMLDRTRRAAHRGRTTVQRLAGGPNNCARRLAEEELAADGSGAALRATGCGQEVAKREEAPSKWCAGGRPFFSPNWRSSGRPIGRRLGARRWPRRGNNGGQVGGLQGAPLGELRRCSLGKPAGRVRDRPEACA